VISILMIRRTRPKRATTNPIPSSKGRYARRPVLYVQRRGTPSDLSTVAMFPFPLIELRVNSRQRYENRFQYAPGESWLSSSPRAFADRFRNRKGPRYLRIRTYCAYFFLDSVTKNRIGTVMRDRNNDATSPAISEIARP